MCRLAAGWVADLDSDWGARAVAGLAEAEDSDLEAAAGWAAAEDWVLVEKADSDWGAQAVAGLDVEEDLDWAAVAVKADSVAVAAAGLGASAVDFERHSLALRTLRL